MGMKETVSLSGPVTLNDLKQFIAKAQEFGYSENDTIGHEIQNSYHYNQFDSSPGNFTLILKAK